MYKRPFWAITALALLTGATSAMATIKTRIIEYTCDGVQLEGYLAWNDELSSLRPGILVVHEWKGLQDYERNRAEELAKLGYIAFAADIYGKGVRPDSREAAMEQSGKYKNDRTLLRKRVSAGLDVLRKQVGVDAKKIAAIGYCFGGMTVLELARSGADVAGAVSFHGSLDTPNPDDARNIKGKVLVLQGSADGAAPPDKVAAFQKEMADAGVDWQFITYGGVVHAFTNPAAGNDPSKGAAYDAKAAARAWQSMQDFFNEIFR